MKKKSNSLDGFMSIPRPDANGMCNNEFAARFMEGASN